MDKIVTENLFLLEFLVDTVNLNQNSLPNIGETDDTCVSVQFLDNPPLAICEDDFTTKKRCSNQTPNVTSGKSCLFSLTPKQAEDAKSKFDIHISVFKKLEDGGGPEKIQLGTSTISVVNLFTQLIAAVNAQPNDCKPTDKTLKDNYQISNAAGENVGTLGMYIRMSCFGKLIVTQFQMNMKDKSILFKDREGHSLYRYKKAGVVCSDGSGGCASSNNKNQSAGVGRPSLPIGATLYPNPSCTAPCTTLSQDKPKADVNSCYEEIGASMGGNTVTIRVHKDNKIEQIDSNEDDTTCTCSQECPKHSRAPGGASQSEKPFSFKLGGCGMAASNNVTVVPPVYNAPDGTKITEISDPNRDVFILRISKRGGNLNKKNNLELELCTPKGPDIKPPPKLETKDTEWNNEDAAGTGTRKCSGSSYGKVGKH